MRPIFPLSFGLALTGLYLVASCNGSHPSAPSDAALDGAGPPCPLTAPDSGTPCAQAREECDYADDTALGLGCYCIGPENVWTCCFEAFPCGSDPTHPNITVGAPCCPGSNLAGSSFSCDWCFNTDVELQLACAVDDPHWRQTDASCNSPFLDAAADGSSD